MLFSSIEFILIFLPIFLGCYYLTPRKFRNYILLAGSLFFYGYGEPQYLILILLSIFINYEVACFLDRSEKRRTRKVWFSIGMIYNFGMLILFKYSGFLIINFAQIPGLGFLKSIQFQPTLPLGISFYTFQIVSYMIDVYRKDIWAESNVIQLATYLCMFPQLIAGPILIYSKVKEELENRKETLEGIVYGAKIFIAGLTLKMLLANTFGALWSEITMRGYEVISTPLAWMGAFAYSLQIFFDFNGYSLMAIGLGAMMGFHIPANFKQPYCAKTVTEFWRRWHITLGEWFRDYVYIPLGGSHCSKSKTVLNLLVVWLLTGIWHGAGWNFILWGLSFFILLTIEKLFLYDFLNGHPILAHGYMLIVIPCSWMLFVIEDIKQIGLYFSRLFPFFKGGIAYTNNLDFVPLLSVYGIFFAVAVVVIIGERFFRKGLQKMPMTSKAVTVVLFALCIWKIQGSAENPFLYFRF